MTKSNGLIKIQHTHTDTELTLVAILMACENFSLFQISFRLKPQLPFYGLIVAKKCQISRFVSQKSLFSQNFHNCVKQFFLFFFSFVHLVGDKLASQIRCCYGEFKISFIRNAASAQTFIEDVLVSAYKEKTNVAVCVPFAWMQMQCGASATTVQVQRANRHFQYTTVLCRHNVRDEQLVVPTTTTAMKKGQRNENKIDFFAAADNFWEKKYFYTRCFIYFYLLQETANDDYVSKRNAKVIEGSSHVRLFESFLEI